MLTFYRRLVLRPGDAGSPVALCPRDELSARSIEEAGHYLPRLAPSSQWLGLTARARR